jgi:deoxyadenosine/deoxycytidine kinase
MYIVIEGNIGAGKTSLANLLCREWNATPLLEEFAENTFLPKFYQDPSKFAFPLELSFLAARFKQMNDLFSNTEHKLVISDYHFQKCLLFASVNLPADELELFRAFFTILDERTKKPNLIVYLESDTSRLKMNIEKRGRDYENAIDSTYLNKLSEAYSQKMGQLEDRKSLIINVSKLDFVNNTTDLNNIMEEIKSHIAL